MTESLWNRIVIGENLASVGHSEITSAWCQGRKIGVVLVSQPENQKGNGTVRYARLGAELVM